MAEEEVAAEAKVSRLRSGLGEEAAAEATASPEGGSAVYGHCLVPAGRGATGKKGQGG